MAEVIVIPEGKICDYIDAKLRNDTPEEEKMSRLSLRSS